MGSIQAHQPLVVVDDNVENGPMAVLEPMKVKRNTWSEAQQIALVNQTYLDERCPIGKQSHGEINTAWSKLLQALAEHPDGVFDDFNLSHRSIQRQLSALMEKQDKRNAQALAATGRGGSAVQTDLEQGLQRLLDLRDGLKQRRAVEKSERNTKLARLDEDAKKALKRSMDTYAKKRRSSSDQRSRGSGGGPANVAALQSGLDAANGLLKVAMEQGVEAHAETMWMQARAFHTTHPDLEPHPGPKEAWIAKALAEHRKKVEKAAEGEQPCSRDDDVESVDMAMGPNS